MLIPWPNRLEDGAYEFDGRRHQLPLTEPERGDAIHGLVRGERWTVGEREQHRVVMEHVLEPRPGYPFTVSLAVEYALSESGLTVRTTATNTGPDACPFGSGQHPYLTLGTPSVDSLVLSAPGATVLIEDERGIPRGREPVDGTPYDFRRPREIGATKLDDAFTDLVRGTDGRARVELRDPRSRAGLSLWVDESYRYPAALHRRPAARRLAPEHRGRADDLPAERLPHRRGPGQARARGDASRAPGGSLPG